MKLLRDAEDSYLKKISERTKISRIYSDYQCIGLEVAGILSDDTHKALYIKLAKQFGKEKIMILAKSVAEIKNVRNKGAYFMKLLYDEHSHDKK